MTKSFKFEEITKISASNREATQKMLLQAGFELHEIWEHDSGDNYEVWSQPKTNKQIVLDLSRPEEHNISDVVSEIIDCWLELRAIRDLLSASEPELLTRSNNLTAHEIFLEKLEEQRSDLSDAIPTLQLVFGHEPDLELLSFFDLDERTKNAILQ